MAHVLCDTLPVVSRQREETAAPDAATVSLSIGDVVGRLSPVLLDLVSAPEGTDVPARRVVIVSPGDEATMVTPGDIVLLVGGAPDATSTSEAIAAVTRAGATAVIMKLRAEQHDAAAQMAELHRVAIVAAPSSADWGQVFTLVRTAIGVTPSAAVLDSGPADLFTLANAIAVATGGATTIEDLQLRVVAYSNLDQPIDDVRRDSILGRSVPTYVMQRDDMVEMYRRLWVDTDTVRLPAEEDGRVRPRLGAVVRADGEAIGTNASVSWRSARRSQVLSTPRRESCVGNASWTWWRCSSNSSTSAVRRSTPVTWCWPSFPKRRRSARDGNGSRWSGSCSAHRTL